MIFSFHMHLRYQIMYEKIDFLEFDQLCKKNWTTYSAKQSVTAFFWNIIACFLNVYLSMTSINSFNIPDKKRVLKSTLNSENVSVQYLIACQLTAAVAQLVWEFAPQAKDWVFESKPWQTYVVKTGSDNFTA